MGFFFFFFLAALALPCSARAFLVTAHGLSCPTTRGILVPWPGIEPTSSALVHWVRIHLSMQKTWVPSVVEKLRSHTLWGNKAHKLQLEKPSHCKEDPEQPKKKKDPMASRYQSWDTTQSCLNWEVVFLAIALTLTPALWSWINHLTSLSEPPFSHVRNGFN